MVPIRELIVDDERLYRIVKNHVFSCDKCDPVSVLQAYLDRRKNMYKFDGFTSATLVKLMMQYNNLMIKRDGKSLPEALKREFIWRCGYSDTLIKYESLLSNMQIWEALNLLRINMKSTTINYLLIHRRFRLIESLMDGKKPKTDKEIDDLMAVADVTER